LEPKDDCCNSCGYIYPPGDLGGVWKHKKAAGFQWLDNKLLDGVRAAVDNCDDVPLVVGYVGVYRAERVNESPCEAGACQPAECIVCVGGRI